MSITHLLRALALILLLPAGLAAQGVTVAGGARLYDEEDAGSSAIFGVRTEFPIGDDALLEFSSAIAERPSNVTRGTGSVFEAQIQFPMRLGDVLAPYFGAGAGMVTTYRADGRDEGWKAAFSLSTGVRATLTDQLGLVLDARFRGIGTEFAASHIDVTAGLRYVLPYR